MAYYETTNNTTMKHKLTIAINASFLQPKGGGISEYIYNLITNLCNIDKENTYIVYVLKDFEAYAKQILPASLRLKVIPWDSSFINVICRSLFSQQFWYNEEKLEQFDIFHSPFFHAPKFKHAKVILTVHDLRLYRYPTTYTLPRFLYLYFAVRNSIRRANHIISISQFTKNEIVDTCHVDPNKITIIHEAINRKDFSIESIIPVDLAPETKLLEHIPFILSVGHIEPRKNYERLITAFISLKQRPNTEKLKLVIVGKKAHHFKHTMQLIETNKDVIYLNFVSRSTLLWLYKNASLFAFPSFYEGFGFPPLEAACFGTISAVSNHSCIPEICGNAAIYFNPFDVKGMSNALYDGLYNEVVISQQKQLIEQNLNRFSWKKNAEQTVNIYKLYYLSKK